MKKGILFSSLYIIVLVLHSQSAGLSDNLTAYWKFDEGTGIITHNLVSDVTGTLINNVQWVDDQFGGKAILLDGDSSYVNFGVTNLGISNDFTIGFWMKILGDAGTYLESIMQLGQYGHPFLINIEGNNRLRVMVRTDSGTNYFISPKAMGVNEWIHICISYKDSIRTIYSDGGQIGYDTLSQGNLVFALKNFTIGDALQPFYGLIDEVRIYNRALNEDEISALIDIVEPLPDNVKPTTPKNLVGVAIPGNKIMLNWSPSTDDKKLLGYRLYRDNVLLLTTTLVEVIDSLLAPETEYSYYVTSFDKSNNESAKSNIVSVYNPAEGYLFPPKAIIKVEPGVTVEVGEPVLFDATASTDDQPLVATEINGNQGIFEWDFGDGYTMKIANRNSPNGGSGISVLHYYMSPGDFRAVLYVTDIEGNTDSAVVNIHVYGEAPMAGFEVLHAPFNNRLAQYIFVRIPESLRGSGSFILQVTLTSDEGYYSIIFEKSNLNDEEKILLRNSDLPAGNYLFTAKLLDISNDTITIIREKFNKPYDGAPVCGFDENNAVYFNNELIFPTMPWLFNRELFSTWAHKYINSLCGIGYYPTRNVASWIDYLNNAKNFNLPVIGPVNWDGLAPMNRARNSDINKIVEYAEASKDHQALMMYQWADEPNLGGYENKIPAQVYASWTHKCRDIDHQHPSWIGMYGFDYLKNYENWNDEYNYLYNAKYFGGKRHFVYDAVGADIYPIEFGQEGRMILIDNTRGPIDLWVESIDNQIIRNYNLIPVMQTIETQDVLLNSGHDGITASQVKMEIWLSVVHDVKGLLYFQYFGVTPPENFVVLEEFLYQMDELKGVILGPEAERIITDNANTRSNRVDFMVKENDTALFIFAVRLTEPDYVWEQYPEPESISVTFEISGLDDTLTTVLYENRQIQINGGILTDTFNREAVHIYMISKIPPQDTIAPTMPKFLKGRVVNETQIDLSWFASYDNREVSYNLFRNGNLIATINGTKYSDTALIPGQEYFYYVNAFDTSMNSSGNSDTVYITTYETYPPSVPLNLIAELAGNNEVHIMWDASTDPSGIKNYVVFRNNQEIGIPFLTNYRDTGLNEVESYTYKVAALDSFNNISEFSDEVWISTPDITPPTTPTGLTAVLVNKTQLNISWIASFDNVGVDYYIIYREGKEIVRTQILSYVDEEVMECTEYTYTVSAVDGSGLMSGLSDPYPVSVPDQTSPTVPTGLIALVKSHNQVDLSWNMSEDSCGEVQYKVYRNKVHINTLSDNNYVDSELAANTLYYYKVSAIDNSDNESIPSITVSARTDKVPTNIILNEISRDLNIYPNPSYDEVNIVYLSTEPSQIKVEVRDIIGKLIKVVYNGHSDIGDNKFVWDGTNEENNNVFPGMYICNVFINNKLYKAKLFIIQ